MKWSLLCGCVNKNLLAYDIFHLNLVYLFAITGSSSTVPSVRFLRS